MSDNYIGNYSPDEFTIVLSKGNFVHRITGYADGTFVSMERITPTSAPFQGVGDNSFGRVKRSKTAMNVAITLLQTSPSNSVLQQLQLADASTSDSTWVFNCSMKDMSGQTIASSNTAIIQAPPTATFGSEHTSREWHIYMFGSDLFIGGNMPLAPSEVAAVSAAGGSTPDRWKL